MGFLTEVEEFSWLCKMKFLIFRRPITWVG